MHYTIDRVGFEHQYIIAACNGFFFKMCVMMLTLAFMVQEWWDSDNDVAGSDLITGTERRGATVIENSALRQPSKLIRGSQVPRNAFDENAGAAFLAAF